VAHIGKQWKAQRLEGPHAGRALIENEKRMKAVEEAGRKKPDARLQKAIDSARIRAEERPVLAKEKPLSTEPDELFLGRMAHSVKRRRGHPLMRIYLRITEDELIRRDWEGHEAKAVVVEMAMFEERLE
jgi:hypothetical protein